MEATHALLTLSGRRLDGDGDFYCWISGVWLGWITAGDTEVILAVRLRRAFGDLTAGISHEMTGTSNMEWLPSHMRS